VTGLAELLIDSEGIGWSGHTVGMLREAEPLGKSRPGSSPGLNLKVLPRQ
jgi:hypothetical protein